MSNSNDNNLIWIDLEMTGLNPDTDVIIEIATIVTDANLNILAEGPVFDHELVPFGRAVWDVLLFLRVDEHHVAHGGLLGEAGMVAPLL